MAIEATAVDVEFDIGDDDPVFVRQILITLNGEEVIYLDPDEAEDLLIDIARSVEEMGEK